MYIFRYWFYFIHVIGQKYFSLITKIEYNKAYRYIGHSTVRLHRHLMSIRVVAIKMSDYGGVGNDSISWRFFIYICEPFLTI